MLVNTGAARNYPLFVDVHRQEMKLPWLTILLKLLLA